MKKLLAIAILALAFTATVSADIPTPPSCWPNCQTGQ
jgi:hypothetical protein